MNVAAYLQEGLETSPSQDVLGALRQQAFSNFNAWGIPTTRHEEWKYTRIGSLFTKEYQTSINTTNTLSAKDIDAVRLPAHAEANELVFINGRYNAELSEIRSKSLKVLSLESAAREYGEIISKHLGHSSKYQDDGINALNMAYMQDGAFIYIAKGKLLEHPVYIYHITDARVANVFAQPRSLVYLGEHAFAQLVETSVTIGSQESFTNQVMEIVVEQDAIFEHYKIQNDRAESSQVSTTHIRQTGKSTTYSVAISLNGNIVRNNTNVVMEAEHCESHLYGLYFQEGNSHIDNHTVVDNVKPHCYSNELYKGIMNDNSSGVFNGKIFVRQDAQKTNAYQSNKNVLLSDTASVNTKPQLEIFADDVKCSHGCTIGQLDEEGMFYLKSRGIPTKTAQSLLLHGFAIDILEKIKLAPIRTYVDQLIDHRLELI